MSYLGLDTFSFSNWKKLTFYTKMLTRKVEFSSCIISIEYIYTNADKIKRVLAHVENCNILVNTLFVP